MIFMRAHAGPFLGLVVLIMVGVVSAESFVVVPAAKKKTPSKAVLADDLEHHLKDLIAAFNILIQDAARFQEHYLSQAYALDENSSAEELSRLLDEIKRVEQEIDDMLDGMHTIKHEIVSSKKPGVQETKTVHKKAP